MEISIRSDIIRIGFLIPLILIVGVSLGIVFLFFPYHVALFSIVLSFFLVFTIRTNWIPLFFILLIPVTSIRISIFPYIVGFFNFIYPFHIFVLIGVMGFIFNRLADGIPRTYRVSQYDRFTIILLLFVSWALIAILWSPDYTYSLFKYIQLILNFLAFFILLQLLRTEIDLKRAVNIWVVMGVVASVALLSSILLKERILIKEEIDEGLLYLFFSTGYTNPTRGTGLAADPKYISNFLNMAIFFAIGLLGIQKQRGQRLRLLFVIGFMIFSHLFTQSRGALAGLLTGMAFILLAVPSFRNVLIKNITLTGFYLLIAFLLFLPIQQISTAYHGFVQKETGTRLLSSTQGSDSMEGRFELWRNAYHILSYKNAYIYGLGAGGSAYYVKGLPHIHGVYHSIILDMGIIGVGIFLIIVAILLSRLLKVLRSKESNLQILLCSFYAGLLAFSVNALIDFEYFMPLIWVHLGVGGAMYRLFAEEESAVKQ